MKPHMAPQYKHLITIRAGKPKGSLGDALRSDPDKVRRLSLSEQQLAKAAEDHGTDIVRYMNFALINTILCLFTTCIECKE